MSRNILWRAVASYTAPLSGTWHEFFAYVDAPDRETASDLMAKRLSDEWGEGASDIDFYNLSDEKELREMALGPQNPAGAPLLECGWSGGAAGKPVYDLKPLVLVSSPSLRSVLETAYAYLVPVPQTITTKGARYV